MNELLDTIRAAIAPEATAEARAAGVSSCRTLIAALEPSPATPPLFSPDVMPQLVGMLRGMDFDQLLQTVIAKLESHPGTKTTATPRGGTRPLSIPMVPIRRTAK